MASSISLEEFLLILPLMAPFLEKGRGLSNS
jgi:hypothetical protein